MFEFIRKMFGGKSDFQQFMEDRERVPMATGEQIALDCFHNGLKAGEIVKLTDITQLINENYANMPASVEDGFLDRMKLFVESGEVVSMNGEGREIIFFHRDHAHDLLKKMRG